MSSSSPEQSLPIPEDLRLTTLLKLMTEDFTDSVVARVLSHRGQLPEDAQAGLSAAINREVRVQGFPNFPDRALPGILKPAVISGLRGSGPLASAVLSAWVASHSSLRDLVSDHLRNRGIDTEPPDFSGLQLRDYWSSHEWMSERDSILGSHDDLDKDDVALMLCCVTGRMPSDAVEPPGGENRSMEQNILDQTLSYLGELAVDSPEWEALPGFLASVSALTDANTAALEALASREALATEVSEFLGRHSGQLSYLELDVSGWTVPADFDPSLASEALDLIQQLDELFAEFESIAFQGSTHAETMRLFEEREEVMRRIRSVASGVDALLTPGDGPEVPPDRPNSGEHGPDEVPGEPESREDSSSALVRPEAPEMSSDATLSGLSLSDLHLDFEPGTPDYPVVLENSTNFCHHYAGCKPLPGPPSKYPWIHKTGTIPVILEGNSGVYAVRKHPDWSGQASG